MNEVWNLDPIYKGFDDPAFDADLAALKEKVAAFSAFADVLAETDPIQGLRDGIEAQEVIQRLAMKLAEYAMLRQSVCQWNICGARPTQCILLLPHTISQPQQAVMHGVAMIAVILLHHAHHEGICIQFFNGGILVGAVIA